MSATPEFLAVPVAAASQPSVAAPLVDLPRSPSVWSESWKRLRRDRVGMGALAVVGAFLLLVVLSLGGLVA